MIISALASRHHRQQQPRPLRAARTPRSSGSARSAGSLGHVGDGGRVTLQTLADALGVSRTTASNAFNRPDQLNPALRERVLALAAELGYAGPDPAGRALRSGRSGAIGVLLTERLSYAFDDPAAVATLGGLATEAERAATSLALLPASFSSRRPEPAEAVPRRDRRRVLRLSLPEGHPSVARRARAATPGRDLRHAAHPGRPVRLDRRPRRRARGRGAPARARATAGSACRLPALRADDHEGLVDAQRRRREATYRVTRERLEGYAEALTAAGLSGTTCRSTRRSRTRARAAGARPRALLALDPPPTALLAMSDELALGVIDGARARGPLRARTSCRSSGTTTSPAATPRDAHHRPPAARREGPRRGADAARGARRRHARRRHAPDRARRARLDARYAVTTAPPRRGSPAPRSSPVAGSRRTACAPPKNTLRSLNGASLRPSAASASASTPGSA